MQIKLLSKHSKKCLLEFSKNEKSIINTILFANKNCNGNYSDLSYFSGLGHKVYKKDNSIYEYTYFTYSKEGKFKDVKFKLEVLND